MAPESVAVMECRSWESQYSLSRLPLRTSHTITLLAMTAMRRSFVWEMLTGSSLLHPSPSKQPGRAWLGFLPACVYTIA